MPKKKKKAVRRAVRKIKTACKKKKITKKKRAGQVKRVTNETNIDIRLVIDGMGKSSIKTGVSFLDHMLILLSRHGYFDLTIKAKGDLDVDLHHTNEDIAITLGEAFAKSLGSKKGIRRYGYFYVPMGDALVRVVLDFSNRPNVCIEGLPQSEKGAQVYTFDDCTHFLKSFAQKAGIDLHVTVLSGQDRHHIIEAIFKALARALDSATQIDSRDTGVPSTKGVL